MPNYVTKQLVKYDHKPPKCHQACPYKPNPVKYGKHSQELNQWEESPLLGETKKKFVQQVVDSFLYYARAVNMTIPVALSDIAADSVKPTEKTLQ